MVTVDFGTQLVVDASGQAWTVTTRSKAGTQTVEVDGVDVGTTTLCSGSCAGGAMRIGPDGTRHIVYVENGTVKYRTAPPGTDPPGPPLTVASGATTSNLALTPNGRPVVVYATSDQIRVAIGTVSGGWTQMSAFPLDGPGEEAALTAVALDDAGRIHATAETVTTSGGFSSKQLIRYRMVCP